MQSWLLSPYIPNDRSILQALLEILGAQTDGDKERVRIEQDFVSYKMHRLNSCECISCMNQCSTISTSLFLRDYFCRRSKFFLSVFLICDTVCRALFLNLALVSLEAQHKRARSWYMDASVSVLINYD